MSNDKETGVKKQVAGSLKEAIGKITGDAETQAEGAVEKKIGEIERKDAAISEEKNTK